MIALGLGLAILATFTVVGAGPSLWLLGPRWRSLWPLVAPPLGFGLVVVAGDVPSWFLAAPSYAWPLFALLVGASLALLHRHRRDTSPRSAALLALPAALLPWALAHYLARGELTTVSEHNHDWLYYLNLETMLGRAGYGAPWHDTGDLFADMGAVLRRGGWRAGLSIAGSWLSALSGLAPHQLDGVMWGVLHACIPGSALAAHHVLVPKASPRARVFVVASAALSGPALLMLRMSFASHLAAMPLLVLALPFAWRGLTARRSETRALAVLLLAATISVLADASPYLALLGLALVVGARHGAAIPWAQLRARAAWALLAPALVPCAMWRIWLSIRSLQVTGYHPPAARFDASLGSIVTTALGQHVHGVDWAREPLALVLVVVAGCAAGGFLLGAVLRLRARATRVALLAPLLVGAVVTLACDLLDLEYPAWKVALTSSPFVALALGAALDRWPRIGPPAAALVLTAQLATVAAASLRAPEPVGVLPVHETLVRALDREEGEVYLLGHQGLREGVAHEHALVYLLSLRGRALRTIPHPASYLRISWPPPRFAVRGEERLLVVTPDEDRVIGGGRVVLRSSPFTVLEPPPGGVAASIAFGHGFLPREVEPDRVFRWSDARSSLFVDLPTDDSCLSGTVRGTPDGDATGLRVTVRALAPHSYEPDAERVLWDGVVPLGYHWERRTIARAQGEARTVHVELQYLGARRPERVDTRPIHFTLGELELRRGPACDE